MPAGCTAGRSTSRSAGETIPYFDGVGKADWESRIQIRALTTIGCKQKIKGSDGDCGLDLGLCMISTHREKVGLIKAIILVSSDPLVLSRAP